MFRMIVLIRSSLTEKSVTGARTQVIYFRCGCRKQEERRGEARIMKLALHRATHFCGECGLSPPVTRLGILWKVLQMILLEKKEKEALPQETLLPGVMVSLEPVLIHTNSSRLSQLPALQGKPEAEIKNKKTCQRGIGRLKCSFKLS